MGIWYDYRNAGSRDCLPYPLRIIREVHCQEIVHPLPPSEGSNSHWCLSLICLPLYQLLVSHPLDTLKQTLTEQIASGKQLSTITSKLFTASQSPTLAM